jgi:hypothetical protein
MSYLSNSQLRVDCFSRSWSLRGRAHLQNLPSPFHDYKSSSLIRSLFFHSLYLAVSFPLFLLTVFPRICSIQCSKLPHMSTTPTASRFSHLCCCVCILSAYDGCTYTITWLPYQAMCSPNRSAMSLTFVVEQTTMQNNNCFDCYPFSFCEARHWLLMANGWPMLTRWAAARMAPSLIKSVPYHKDMPKAVLKHKPWSTHSTLC